MKLNAPQLGHLIRDTRKLSGVTQKNLALVCGTGVRFIIDLEKGKETCQLGKVLIVINTLGIKINFIPPPVRKNTTAMVTASSAKA